MPPKTKSKKVLGKSSAVVDGLSTDEMSKDQLEEHIIRLREELDREREERSYFQLERDKIQVYKQKLKHVLSEQHNTVSGLKIDGVSSSGLIRLQNAEKELGAEERNTRPKHQVELMELTNTFDKRFRDIEVKYHKKTEAMIQARERALRGAEEYYSAAQSKLMGDQKLLKEELAEVTKLQVRSDKDLSSAQQENRKLSDALQEAQQTLPALHRQLQEGPAGQEQDGGARVEARVKLMDQELRDLTVEHELLLQAFEKVQQERDDLLRNQTQTLLDVQQRSGLKAAAAGEEDWRR
ncbi:hypothetical protein KUCAC02_026673 [Chaenocephalus aceratus]|nr:hypothetical protein KUCAC02_026673 [Chaenocephalus aceratus]